MTRGFKWIKPQAGRSETSVPTDGKWIVAETTLGNTKRLRYSRARKAFVLLNGTLTSILDITRWRYVDPPEASPAPFWRIWRTSAQVRGYRSALQAAINASHAGAYAVIDLATARALVQICRQAEHTEEGHGQ